MGFDSIEAMIDLRNDRAQHLAFGARKTGWSEHRALIQINARVKGIRIEALHAKNIRYVTSAAHGLFVFLLERSRGVTGLNDLDPCHAAVILHLEAQAL